MHSYAVIKDEEGRGDNRKTFRQAVGLVCLTAVSAVVVASGVVILNGTGETADSEKTLRIQALEEKGAFAQLDEAAAEKVTARVRNGKFDYNNELWPVSSECKTSKSGDPATTICSAAVPTEISGNEVTLYIWHGGQELDYTGPNGTNNTESLERTEVRAIMYASRGHLTPYAIR